METYDSDNIPGLAYWVDSTGAKTDFPRGATSAFLKTNSYLWNEEILEHFLEGRTEVYLFGLASNVFDLFHYFDKVYYLDVSDKTEVDRLTSTDRHNPDHFGETDEQIRLTLQYVHNSLRPMALKSGIVFIDASKAPSEIYQQIVDL